MYSTLTSELLSLLDDLMDIDGSMKDFRLVRGLDPLMDAEALRVLQLVNEKWSTGYYFNSKKWYREFYVNQFTIPIIFSW